MGLLPMRSGLDGDPGFGPQAVALDRHYHEVQNLVEAIPFYYLALRTRIQNLSELISLSTSSTTEVVRHQAILAPQFVAGLRPGRHAADRGLSLSTVAMPRGEAGRSQVGSSRVVMMVSPRRGRESDHREGHGRGSYRRRRGSPEFGRDAEDRAPAGAAGPVLPSLVQSSCTARRLTSIARSRPSRSSMISWPSPDPTVPMMTPVGPACLPLGRRQEGGAGAGQRLGRDGPSRSASDEMAG